METIVFTMGYILLIAFVLGVGSALLVGEIKITRKLKKENSDHVKQITVEQWEEL